MPPPHPHSPPPGRAQGARRARGGSREHALTLTPAPEARTAWYPHTRQLRHTDTRKIHKRAGTHSRVGYAHAPQTHTRYRQFCTHTHACTYSKSINRHTHTPQKFAVTQPHAHTASHRDGTQERPTGHSVHSLDDAILRDRWCIASFRCWGQHRGQNRPSPALRELTF